MQHELGTLHGEPGDDEQPGGAQQPHAAGRRGGEKRLRGQARATGRRGDDQAGRARRQRPHPQVAEEGVPHDRHDGVAVAGVELLQHEVAGRGDARRDQAAGAGDGQARAPDRAAPVVGAGDTDRQQPEAEHAEDSTASGPASLRTHGASSRRACSGPVEPTDSSGGSTGPEHALRELAPWVRRLAGPLADRSFGVLGLGLLALAIARADDRRRAIWGSGLAVAGAGGLIAAGITASRDLVLEQFDTSYGDAVVSVVWNAFLGDLRVWALAACAAGLVVAAAAGGPRLAAKALLAAPPTRGMRLLRAAGLLVVAGFAVQSPQLVLHIGLVALAAAAFYVAAGDLLRVFAPPHGTAPQRARRGRRRRAARADRGRCRLESVSEQAARPGRPAVDARRRTRVKPIVGLSASPRVATPPPIAVSGRADF